MPSPTTIDEFLELVRKSGVVDDKRLTAYLEKVRSTPTLPSEPVRLAGLLVRDGLLTHFQAEQFLQGKWRRFTIGKYKVLERLGAGGMGSVYLCEHKLMRRRVAVKVLPTAKADDTSSLERFYREARAVAALDHPNIVRAYDIDQDDKLHFLVMEHVDGSSLQEIVKKTGPMDVLRACHYIRQAALGLQHAHETAGLVHRDIKPGNILVDRNGIVKILDMGLARFFHDEEDILTKKFEENVLGTADYLAPEQALDSHSVDIRADIYSLGATFYFCLTGRTPFAEGTVAQKLIWHQTRQPKPLRQLRPEVPEGVIALVEKMMAKDAGQRYPMPMAVADALVPWTQTPIPPPPENEMPQLSLAAMGTTLGDSSMSSGGPKTPPSGELIPTPRKVWQVSQNATPAPLSSPSQPGPSAPAPSPRDSRKTTLPPNSDPLALQSSTLNPAVAPVPVVTPLSPRVQTVTNGAAQNQRIAPNPAPTTPGSRPIAINGTPKALTTSVMPESLSEPAGAEESPSWEALVAESDASSNGYNETAPRSGRRGPSSSSKRLSGLTPVVEPTRRLGWVVAIASLIVVTIIVVVGILASVFGKRLESSPRGANEPLILHVNRLGSNDASPTIAAALHKLHSRARVPAKIVVHDDLSESDVFVDLPNLTIEAEAGKVVHWKPSSKPGSSMLLRINKAEGFRLKGFTLDGDDRIDFLINLYHHCPAVTLEDLTLQGFKKYGIWVTNCEGGETIDRYVLLQRLDFVTTKDTQAALFFSIEKHTIDAIPSNKFFIIRDCKFEGPGVKLKTPDLATLNRIEYPASIRAVQGQ